RRFPRSAAFRREQARRHAAQASRRDPDLRSRLASRHAARNRDRTRVSGLPRPPRRGCRGRRMNRDALLVTGGAGFIGSNFVRHWMAREGGTVVNLDKLTYAGNLGSLRDLEGNPGHVFVRGDICDVALVSGLLSTYRPWAIVHLAAESHVDRSIHGPVEFLQTNVIGTFRLLECAREYWTGL